MPKIQRKTRIANDGASFDAHYSGVSLGKYPSAAYAKLALKGARFVLRALQEGTILQGESLQDFIANLDDETLPRVNPEVQAHLRDHPLLQRTKP